MPKVAKRIAALREQVDPDKAYPIIEAIGLVKKCATAKFDETVELHMKTGLDGRHADQQLRGSVILPNGVGKDVRVLVFAEGEAAANAEAAAAPAPATAIPPRTLRLDTLPPVPSERSVAGSVWSRSSIVVPPQ